MNKVREAKKKLESYHWMKRIVDDVEKNRREGKPSVSKWGEYEPRPKHLNSNPVWNQSKHNIEDWESIKHYYDSVKEVKHAVSNLEDERERFIARGIMSATRAGELAMTLSVSRTTYYEIRDRMYENVASIMYGEKSSP